MIRQTAHLLKFNGNPKSDIENDITQSVMIQTKHQSVCDSTGNYVEGDNFVQHNTNAYSYRHILNL